MSLLDYLSEVLQIISESSTRIPFAATESANSKVCVALNREPS